MQRTQTESSPRRRGHRHLAFVIAGFVALSIAYVVLVAVMRSNAASPAEQTFESRGSAKPLDVYADLLAIDPARDEVRMRLSFGSQTDPPHLLIWGSPDRNIVVDVDDSENEQRIHLDVAKPAPAVDFAAVMNGDEASYPFDRFRSLIEVRAYQGTVANPRHAIPVHLTVWTGLSDWSVRAQRQPAQPGSLQVGLLIDRAGPITFFALVTYASMALAGASAIAVGMLAFLKIRRIEATLTGALAAIVLDLPALRYVLPGSPPVGVWADILVFLWAEVAVVVALALFVWSWARRGTG